MNKYCLTLYSETTSQEESAIPNSPIHRANNQDGQRADLGVNDQVNQGVEQAENDNNNNRGGIRLSIEGRAEVGRNQAAGIVVPEGVDVNLVRELVAAQHVPCPIDVKISDNARVTESTVAGIFVFK